MAVYMIHSPLSLAELSKRLDNKALLMHIDYHQGYETDRTIVLLPKEVYASLAKDIKIAPYEIRDYNLPGQGKVFSFFIPLDGHDPQRIRDLLEVCIKAGLLHDNMYTLTVPLVSRFTGERADHCIVEFGSHVDREDIARIRVLLEGMPWCADSPDARIRCSWGRGRKGKPMRKVDVPDRGGLPECEGSKHEHSESSKSCTDKLP